MISLSSLKRLVSSTLVVFRVISDLISYIITSCFSYLLGVILLEGEDSKELELPSD